MSDPQIKQTMREMLSGRIIRQVSWLMIWPTLTVIIVVGAVYLDRMHILKKMTASQGALLVEYAGSTFLKSLQLIDADMKYLQNNKIIQELLADPAKDSAVQVQTILKKLVDRHSDYMQISLCNRNGEALTRSGSTGDTLAGALKSDPFFADLHTFDTAHIHVSAAMYRYGDNDGEQHGNDGLQFVQAVSAGPESKIGYIVIDYLPVGLRKLLGNLSAEFSGSIYLIDPQGHIIAGLVNTGHSELFSEVSGRFGVGSSTQLWKTIKQYGSGQTFFSGGAYAYSNVQVLTDRFLMLPWKAVQKSAGTESNSSDLQFYILSEIPAVYFSAQKTKYIWFLFLLAAALLIPSLVVCVFLARSRKRLRVEESLRYFEHERHLAQLEEKVKRRTVDLDDVNLKLSAEIAERLSTESRLRGSNELLTGMVESIDGIIYVADMESYEILFANEYVKRLFGFDPVGKKCWQFIHANQQGPCTFCTNCRLLDADGNPCEPYHWEYQNPFSKKWYAAKDQAIRWSSGKYVRLEIAIDITEHKRLQFFLKEARKQAEIAIGARSRFVALVAHDLKSPFFSITQMLKRILERETFSHEVHRQFLENIVENGHRMLQMIDNLLSMDRFKAGDVKIEKTFFNVSEMADDVLQNFRHPAFEKGIKLINSIPAASQVYADRYLYFMVLNNMISNAIKFSDRGGEVELFLPPGNVSMSVAVRDTGRGMTREYMADLFKADVKTSCRGTGGEKGSGLGLVFCQDIIRAHDGMIRVDSDYGKGSTFYIDLPACSSIETSKADA